MSHSRRPTLKEPRNSSFDNTFLSPGTVKINVQGAFIVDQVASDRANLPQDGARHDTRDIRLPNHKAEVSHVALDIGGSLAKLVYFSPEPDSNEVCTPQSNGMCSLKLQRQTSNTIADPRNQLGGRLNFLSFETDRIDQCFHFVLQLKSKQQTLNGSRPGELCVVATGGGAFKYYDEMRKVLGTEVLREDEMECLIMGLDFFITEIPREVFTYTDPDPMHFEEPRADVYPYLLVNIGSGVSMVRVSGPEQFERVGGTSLGGGTLWGLLSLLTGARTFDAMLAMADRGDNATVDMLVGDIYGTDYSKIGLKTNTIASSFGKVFKMKRQGESDAEDGSGFSNGDPRPASGSPDSDRAFAPEDISRSLLYAISNNIGQIAYLQSEKHTLEHIYFGGSFIRGHRQTMNTLSYAIKFWSKGEKKAYFLRHEGYLGSVGAFLKRQPKNWGRRNSFEE
ncbi:MAG: hypothetical protein ASARMPRED_004440 [Alectoria sarmentosa]|nr:MAG: hypothetical protein ASARMPRED_004440 [Alectoria sarmentosa]